MKSGSSDLSPNQRRILDLELTKSMEVASKGVGTIIKLGRKIIADNDLMETIMDKLKYIFASSNVKQRVYLSYALLILCSFKVHK